MVPVLGSFAVGMLIGLTVSAWIFRRALEGRINEACNSAAFALRRRGHLRAGDAADLVRGLLLRMLPGVGSTRRHIEAVDGYIAQLRAGRIPDLAY